MPDASPRASRRATPRWLDARLVLGVILVLLAVVTGARVFAASAHYTQVYVARDALVPGEHLSAADLGVGEVRFSGEGGRYVAATASPPIGYLVTRYVGSGEFVPLDAVSAVAADASNSRFVTVPVEPGHLPADVGHGDLVDVYLTAKSGDAADVPAPTRVLAAVAVDSYDGGSQSLSGGSMVSVVLTVPVGSVAQLVHAVESGTIDLVRVPAAAVASAPAPAGDQASASAASQQGTRVHR